MKDLDCEGLFGNIESVLKTSQKLLTSLENAVDDTKGNDQELGNVLIACLWNAKFCYGLACYMCSLSKTQRNRKRRHGIGGTREVWVWAFIYPLKELESL